MVQNPSKSHFGVILTHFSLGSVGSHCSFRGFSDPKPAKSVLGHNGLWVTTGQNGPYLCQIRLSKVSSAARKCWQRAFLGTKMPFASLCHGLFYLSAGGGRVAFQRNILATACRCVVPFNGKAHWFIGKCSVYPAIG